MARYEEIVVTPEMAKLLLENNPVNRNISMNDVKKYANMMKAGNWPINGETISVYKSGRLANGQNRLLAVIEAGIPVKMTFAFDIDDDVFVFDEGRKRSISDRMKLMGEDKSISHKTMVAMANVHFSVKEFHTKKSVSSKNSKATSDEVIDFLCRNENVVTDIFRLTSSKTHSKNGTVGLRKSFFLAALFYALNSGSLDDTNAERFCQIVFNGFIQKPSENCAVVIRNDLLGWQMIQKNPSNTVLWTFRVEKAINDFINKSQRHLSYRNWNKPIFSQLPVNLNA